MELIAAVAIGLNPYIGMFVLAALAAFTTHVPDGALMEMTSIPMLGAVAVLFGLAAPFDFVFGKFVRFAPVVRRLSQLVAPFAGALAAVTLTDSNLPLPVVATIGAALSWSVAAMLTSIAARASRSAAWVGMGHIPVLMAAATSAACIVPLALAKPGIGYALSGVAFLTLVSYTLAGLRKPVATTLARPARRSAPVAAQALAR
ncbi:MAG TPA: hypothetical protein VFX49_14560 [Chloroflexota bacterium]|nr:hypothetical protein [Chloroflexota bacterium]